MMSVMLRDYAKLIFQEEKKKSVPELKEKQLTGAMK